MLGMPPSREQVEAIRKKLMSYPGVLGMHDLMVHDYGPGNCFASVHVEMDASGDILESHDVTDQIERDFQKQGIPEPRIVTRFWIIGIILAVSTLALLKLR